MKDSPLQPEADGGVRVQRVVRCVCGGKHFHRNYPVAGRWREFVKANASGGVEVIESTTDGLTRGKEPAFMRCDKCGKRVRNPEAPNNQLSDGPAEPSK